MSVSEFAALLLFGLVSNRSPLHDNRGVLRETDAEKIRMELCHSEQIGFWRTAARALRLWSTGHADGFLNPSVVPTRYSRSAEWSQLSAVQTGRVYVTDGNQYFNRPGPRVVESAEILAELLHPGIFDFGHRDSGWRPWPSHTE